MKRIYIATLFLLLSQVGLSQNPSPPVYVVLFTHIEDNTPSSDIGTPEARQEYIGARNNIVEMARLAKTNSITWVLQPDWKLLLTALEYEDAAMMSNTAGKNVFRYLLEDLQVPIDAHSHEKQGYNYADVAHLLDSLGVGGSTVIGGHIWDPDIPQFSGWDRFRVPLVGTMFPWSRWRGDILMGSGTPNHVNDPHPSGVWRPKDKYHYWEDDPAGNIYCIGQYAGDVSGIIELTELYQTGQIDPGNILTASIHITPAEIMKPGGIKLVLDSIISPLVSLRDQGKVEITDFTSLIETWKTLFGSKAHIHDPGFNSTKKVVSTFLPSGTGGPEGIYTEIVVPDKQRYDDGAPVVIHVAGGWAPDGMNIAQDALTPGFVEIRFNFPGGGQPGKRSGGTYDDRGEACIKASRDVVRFALGLTADVNGKYLKDLTADITPLSNNVGLCGWSNGGNATLTTAGLYGKALNNLAWIVNWESPVGDGMPSVEAGSKQKLNPAYNANTGEWDLSTLSFSDTLVVSKPGVPVLRGGLFIDIDNDGFPNEATDFLLTPYLYRGAETKVFYSNRVIEEADGRGLIPPGAASHLATKEETGIFWNWRNAETHIASAISDNPDLMFIICASAMDHVQGAPDHPHVLTQYDLMQRAGCRFVRLNPDRSYCEEVGGVEFPKAADNDAFQLFSHLSIATGLEPEGPNFIPDLIYVSAAVLELADRTWGNELTSNLDSTINLDVSTGVNYDLADIDYRLEISSNPVTVNASLSVVSGVAEHVALGIYDIIGREIASLHDDWLGIGTHRFALPQLSPGVHLIVLRTGRKIYTMKMVQL